MKVLIIGNGGREHALALSLCLSSHVSEVFCCPGNPGISRIANCVPLPTNDFQKLAEFASEKDIDLSIVFSDVLLEQGIVDFFEYRGQKVFGPRRDAAQLEWSKYFAKEFMLRRDIPTARYAAFEKKEYAMAYAHSRKLPTVIKASGLAQSKGVAIANSYEAAAGAINAYFQGKFGGTEGGQKVILVEDYLSGYELSISAICDGENYAILPSAKSYTRLYEEDRGPITEGMGAISPHPLATPEIIQQIEKTILQPTLRGMKEEGRSYKGFLNLEVLVDQTKQPYLLEFNCSLGDPEAQALLLLLECDLFEVIWQATAEQLGYFKGILPSAEQSGTAAALSVVMSSQGYPDKVASGMPIRFQTGLSLGPQCQLIDQSGEVDNDLCRLFLFHMGTKLDNNRNLVTGGGRVLGVTALAADQQAAYQNVYRVTNKIRFASNFFRRDLGNFRNAYAQSPSAGVSPR